MYSLYYTALQGCILNLIPDSYSLILRLSNEVSFFSKFLLKGAQKTQNINLFKWMNACKSSWLQFNFDFFLSFLEWRILKLTIIVEFKYISVHKGILWRSKCRNQRNIKFLATFTNVLAPRLPVLHFDYFDHLSKKFLEKLIPH